MNMCSIVCMLSMRIGQLLESRIFILVLLYANLCLCAFATFAVVFVDLSLRS